MSINDAAPATQDAVTATQWLATPPGRYVLDREQAYFDNAVADIFGHQRSPAFSMKAKRSSHFCSPQGGA
jgi:hypothetical protein